MRAHASAMAAWTSGCTRVGEMAEVGGEIAGSDENTVDSFNCGNRFNLRAGAAGFDLDEHADGFMRYMVIACDAAVAIGARSDGDSPNAARGIACGGDGLAGFFGVLHERDEQGARADIEHALDDDRVVPRYADYWLGGAGGHCLELREQAGDFVGGMFGIEHDPVETGAGDDFGRDVTAERAPETDLLLASVDGGFKSIGRKGRHGLVGGGFLDVIDDENFDGQFLRVEFEAELRLDLGKDGTE